MAVITRTECLLLPNGIRRIQGIVLILVVFWADGTRSNPQGCDVARKEVAAAGFPASMVLDRPSGGAICGMNSCCSTSLEQDMLARSRMQVDVFLRDSISKLASLIDVRAKKFDGFFKEMMNNSKREFHNMFHRTYGKIYLQNSDVFSDFFVELETYYKKGSVRLSETMETFFGILYQRMFKVINGQYTFDDKYLECVSEHMAEMRPFGDVPHKLGVQLRRSFVATRTYHKALSTAAESAKKLMHLRVDEECGRELTKMQHCGKCRGQTGPQACSDFCTSVLEACLKHHTAFSSEWDNFVDALDKVADRLIGPFNIEMVVEPLNIKISEAIMNFQESGTEVSKKIYTVCGKPTLNRRKREANIKDTEEDNPKYEINSSEPLKLHHGHKKKKNKKYEEEDNVPTLAKIIKEIKTKVRETRQFWAHLPYQFCNNASVAAPPSENGHCWNGTAVGDFTKSKSKFQGKPATLVGEQIFSLQVFTDKLRKAHEGNEVEIVDDSEDILENGSGSGSGGGVDDDLIDEEDDDVPLVIPDETLQGRGNQPPHPPEVVTSTSTSRPEDDEDDNNINRSYSGGSNTISLSKALSQYLIPIVLVWFGGAITELL